MISLYRMVRIALSALRRHKMRTGLTCLGIVIGVAAVIAMTEIVQGSAIKLREIIASVGASVVQIDPSDAVKAGASSGSGGGMTLTPADCDAILRECSSVILAAPSFDVKAQVSYGNRNWAPQDVRGTTPEYLVIRNWAQMAEGSMFTDHDVSGAAAVCVLGQTVAWELFQGESPIGKTVRVKSLQMKVIGLLSPKGTNMMGRDQDDYLIAPWTTVRFRLTGSRQATAAAAQQAAGGVNTLSCAYPTQAVQLYPQQSAVQAIDMPMLKRFSDLDDIFVSAASPEEVPLAIRQITAVLRQRHRLEDDQPDDFRIRDLTEISQTMASASETMGNLLLGVATISLLVGGVGVSNIMLASVKERTREIGLRLAVGARARDILRQFLTEAVILCLVGGLAGILLGHGVSVAIAKVLDWQTLISLPAIAVSFGVSASVGIIFGFYPAWKASRLDPIEALRYE
jgi:ABC-type antimicrobial peptide transport system permease subunit